MSVKNNKWSSTYGVSDIARVNAISAYLEKQGKPRRALITEYGLARQTTYDVLNGHYHAPPTKHIERIEQALGIKSTKPKIEIDIDLWAPAPAPDEPLREQLMRVLSSHSKVHPIAREKLIDAVKGERTAVTAALDALITERLVCDVIIWSRDDPAAVYCYPSGCAAGKYSFRVAAPTEKHRRRL